MYTRDVQIQSVQSESFTIFHLDERVGSLTWKNSNSVSEMDVESKYSEHFSAPQFN